MIGHRFVTKQGCFCKTPELIENYEKAIEDTTQIWECHHRLETHFSDGTPRLINGRLSIAELKALGMYYNRPPEELIFLTNRDHKSLHFKGRESPAKGKPGYWLGKHHSEETKRKISENTDGKKISLALKGKSKGRGINWYNNGIINVKRKECPEGFVLGRIGRGRFCSK